MSEQDLLLIELYYRNELGEAERLAFEQRLTEDADFREEALLHQRALAAIRLHAKDLLKKKLQDRPVVAPDPRPQIWRWAAGAAALLLAAWLIGYCWTQAHQPPPIIAPPQSAPTAPTDTAPQKNAPPPLDTASPPPSEQAKTKPRLDKEKLFADAYQPHKPDPGGPVKSATPTAPQDTGSSKVTTINQLKQLAQEGKHAESLAAYELLPQDMKGRDIALFFKANSLMALGRSDEATALFEGIGANPQSAYASYAQWYAALCALKKGDLPKAKKWLRQVAAEGGNTSKEQREEAKKLLERLR